MTTNVLQLSQISGSLTIATNADLRETAQLPQLGSSEPLDLTGIAFHMQVRPAPGSAEVALDLSTDNGLLINNGGAGTISLLAPKAALAQIAPGAYVADLLAIADGATINLCLNGPLAVTVDPGVTC
jgi:hypothetical protein